MQCCRANVIQWDYHIYMAVHQNVFMWFAIIQHYGNVNNELRQIRNIQSSGGKGEFFSIANVLKELRWEEKASFSCHARADRDLGNPSWQTYITAKHHRHHCLLFWHEQTCRAASWYRVRDMKIDSWDQREIGIFPLSVNEIFLCLHLIFQCLMPLRGMKEASVFKTSCVSGNRLSTLYILIHLTIYLLSDILKSTIYMYLNPQFAGEETADQKAEVIWVRLPKIWTWAISLQFVFSTTSLHFMMKYYIFPSYLLFFVLSAWISSIIYFPLPRRSWDNFLTMFWKYDQLWKEM